MEHDPSRRWLGHLRVHMVGELLRLATASELAFYLRLNLCDVIDCRYVSFVQLATSGHVREIGASPGTPDARHNGAPSRRDVAVALIDPQARGSWSEGSLHLRSIDDDFPMFMCLGVGPAVESVRVRSVMDALVPALSVYATMSTSLLSRNAALGSRVHDGLLTERQSVILSLIAKGLSNPAIAQRIGYSHSLVRQETTRIFHGLEVANRQDAVLAARKRGLLA